VRVKGYKPTSKTFRTKSQAKTWAQSVEDDMRAGRYRQAGAETLGDLFHRYLREIVPLKKTYKFHNSNIQNLHRGLGDIGVWSFSAQSVVDYVHARKAAASTVRKEVNTLNHVLKTAASVWNVPVDVGEVQKAKDILAATRALSQPKPRNRRLSDGEQQKLLAALNQSPETLLLVLLTLSTARRLKELMAINADLLVQRQGRHFLRVLDNKTDRPLDVPLSQETAALLYGFGGFTMRSDSYSQAFARAVKRAGLSDLKLTDLRREALSRLFEADFSVPEVMAISGHASPDVLLKVYSQVESDRLQAKLNRAPG